MSCRYIAEALTQLSSAPAVDIPALLQLYVLSNLIGNGDLHAKNVSLLRSQDGIRSLSPAYDPFSTLPHGEKTMALRLDGKDDNFHLLDLSVSRPARSATKAVESMSDELLHRCLPLLEQLGGSGLAGK